jgi:hypothetical protein
LPILFQILSIETIFYAVRRNPSLINYIFQLFSTVCKSFLYSWDSRRPLYRQSRQSHPFIFAVPTNRFQYPCQCRGYPKTQTIQMCLSSARSVCVLVPRACPCESIFQYSSVLILKPTIQDIFLDGSGLIKVVWSPVMGAFTPDYP